MTRDRDLRAALHAWLPGGLLVRDELRIVSVLVDVAAFGPRGSAAYEIKSPLDTPRRLAGQLREMVLFDDSYVVCHLSQAGKYLRLSEHAGLIAVDDRGEVTEMKPPCRPPVVHPRLLAGALHTPERKALMRRILLGELHGDKEAAHASLHRGDFTAFDYAVQAIAYMTDQEKRTAFRECVANRHDKRPFS